MAFTFEWFDYRLAKPTHIDFPSSNSDIASKMYATHREMCAQTRTFSSWVLLARNAQSSIVGASMGRWECIRGHPVVRIEFVCNLTSAPRVGQALMGELFRRNGSELIYCLDNCGGTRGWMCYVHSARAAGLSVYSVNERGSDLQELDQRIFARLVIASPARSLRSLSLVFFAVTINS